MSAAAVTVAVVIATSTVAVVTAVVVAATNVNTVPTTTVAVAANSMQLCELKILLWGDRRPLPPAAGSRQHQRHYRCNIGASWGVNPPNPGKKHISTWLGGLSSAINPTHRRGTQGLMWGARGMVIVGSWLLGDVSTVGIVQIFYRNTLFFGPNFRHGLKLRQKGGACLLNFWLFHRLDQI